MNAIAPCASLAEVRQHIDRLDRQLEALIAERGTYVQQAARFKKSQTEVAAPQRVEQVIAKVKAVAAEAGADLPVIEATWRAMIGAFIELEKGTHAALHPSYPHPN